MNWIAMGLAVAMSQAAPAGPLDDGVLTMDEAVTVALTEGFTVQRAQQATARAEAQSRAAEAALGVSASFSGSYAWFDGTAGLTTGGGSFGGTTGGTRQDGGTGDTGGGSRVNTFNQLVVSASKVFDISGRIRAGIRATDWFVEASKVGEAVAANGVRGDVRSAYLQALRAQELVVIQLAVRTSIAERLDKTKVMFDAGSVPQFDVLRLENTLVQADRNLVDAQLAADLAKRSLMNLMGMDDETSFDLQAPAAMTDALAEDSALVQRALKERPELDATSAQIQAYLALEDQAKTLYAPTLALSAQQTYIVGTGGSSDSKSTLALINLSIPLYDSGSSRANRDAARANTVDAEISKGQLSLGIVLQVRAALSNLNSARASLVLAENSLTLAREALRLANLRYDEGAGLLVDVLVAINDERAAAAGVADARFAQRLALAELQRALGTDELTPEATEPPAPAPAADANPNGNQS
ncbi:MAG TPA: TolC family protein [Fimbriimonadaceae bacterium]|nr:TolC family protein [Fimbriimonadaceae bacterium]HRE94919.1 TolC family protein [Fimbriimonadaceae bacterium]